MGLMDNLRSGIGSLASEVSPRNTAADMAMLENNQQQRKKTSEYYMTNISSEELAADKLMEFHRQSLKEDPSYVPKGFNSQEEFNEFQKQYETDRDLQGRVTMQSFHKLYGDEAFWEKANSMGLTSGILGKGKWVDSTNSPLQTIIGEDGEETIGFQPTVRTADPGRKQIYSADMTKGGRNVRDIYAEGGDAALADSRISISLDDLDKVYDRYRSDTTQAGGGDINASFMADSLRWHPDNRQQREDLEAQIATTLAEKEGADATLAEAQAAVLEKDTAEAEKLGISLEALHKKREAAAAATTDGGEPPPLPPGEGIMFDDRLATTADEVAASLPELSKHGEIVYYGKTDSEGNRKSFHGYRQTTKNPFGATDEQWALFSENERTAHTKNAKALTITTNKNDLTKAKQNLLILMKGVTRPDKVIKRGGLANNEAWQVAVEGYLNERQGLSEKDRKAIIKFYEDNPVHMKEDYKLAVSAVSDTWASLFRTNPELMEQFQKDPIQFALDNPDVFGPKPDFTSSQQVNGNMNGASADKVIKAIGIDTGDFDIQALQAEADKLGTLSDKQQEELVKLQNDQNNNFMSYSKKARANLTLKYYTGLRQDSEAHANAFANGAMALFIETGSWDLAGEQFQLDYQKYDLQRQKHNVEVQGILNKAGQITDPSPIFTTAFTTILNQFKGSGGEEATMLTPAGLNEFNFAMKPALINARNVIAGSTTSGAIKGAMNEIDVLSELTMQVLGDYINTISNSKWDTFVSLGFASSNGARAFDSVSNVVPVDQYDQPTTDLSKVRGYIRMNADGTLVGVTGTSHKLSNTTLRKDIGQDGLEMLFTIGLSNYARIIGEKEGTP